MAARQPRGNPPPPADPPSGRSNEYFVPRDGIDREVITADICRYLGNNALVRPGVYESPQGQTVQGYYITAYRNLTSAMIDDLKADSARWDAERRQQAARDGQPGYRDSATHNARQYYGPTDTPTYADSRDPRESAGYPGSTAPGYSANGGGYNSANADMGAYRGQPDPRDPRHAAAHYGGGASYAQPDVPYTALGINNVSRAYNEPYGNTQPPPRSAHGAAAPTQGQNFMNPGQSAQPGYNTNAAFYNQQGNNYAQPSMPGADNLYGRGAAQPFGAVQQNQPPPQGYETTSPRPTATQSGAPPLRGAPAHPRRERESSERHHQSDRHRSSRH